MLLDTAALIFAVEAPHRLTERANAVLKSPNNVRHLSAISLTEIAVKVTLGKLNVSAEMARQALDDMDIRIVSFTAEHALCLFELPLHHRDPFDRQIIAQALCEGIPVVTPDEQFRRYDGVRVVW